MNRILWCNFNFFSCSNFAPQKQSSVKRNMKANNILILFSIIIIIDYGLFDMIIHVYDTCDAVNIYEATQLEISRKVFSVYIS